MYTDNYFTSIHLAMYLYDHRTYLTGTTRSNRVGLPEPIRRKLAKKGDIVNYRRGPLLACAFEDKKHVIILSTHGAGQTGEYTSKGNRKRVTPGCYSWVSSSVQQVHGWCRLVRHENLLLSR